MVLIFLPMEEMVAILEASAEDFREKILEAIKEFKPAFATIMGED